MFLSWNVQLNTRFKYNKILLINLFNILVEFLIQDINHLWALNVRWRCRSMIQTIRTRCGHQRKKVRCARNTRSVQAEIIEQPHNHPSHFSPAPALCILPQCPSDFSLSSFSCLPRESIYVIWPPLLNRSTNPPFIKSSSIFTY